jgi:hypothetical protein
MASEKDKVTENSTEKAKKAKTTISKSSTTKAKTTKTETNKAKTIKTTPAKPKIEPVKKELKKIGTETHALIKNEQLTLCTPSGTVRVRVTNMGGGDVLIQKPIEAKLFAGKRVEIDSNENIVLYSHSFPIVSITYWG